MYINELSFKKGTMNKEESCFLWHWYTLMDRLEDPIKYIQGCLSLCTSKRDRY